MTKDTTRPDADKAPAPDDSPEPAPDAVPAQDAPADGDRTPAQDPGDGDPDSYAGDFTDPDVEVALEVAPDEDGE